MCHDQVRAREVIHVGRPSVVIHRVGHVADQRDVRTQLDQLPNPERPSQDAHVEMDAHDRDMFDLELSQQIVELLGVIRDRVLFRDFERLDLPRPGLANRAFLFAIATHVRVVDGQVRFARWIGPIPASSPTH